MTASNSIIVATAATKMREAEPLTMAVIVLAMLSCALL